jgi:hypothetical protein
MQETHTITYTEETMNTMFKQWVKSCMYCYVFHNEEDNTIEYQYA